MIVPPQVELLSSRNYCLERHKQEFIFVSHLNQSFARWLCFLIIHTTNVFGFIMKLLCIKKSFLLFHHKRLLTNTDSWDGRCGGGRVGTKQNQITMEDYFGDAFGYQKDQRGGHVLYRKQNNVCNTLKKIRKNDR